ncbi:MAG: oligogalacturonate lyase family protein [Phycisphaerae bacterium]
MTLLDKPLAARNRFADPRTGRDVIKLTPWDDCNCPGTYFYLQALSADERYLLFNADRGGTWHTYRLDLLTDDVTRVPGNHADNRWPTMHHDGKGYVCLADGRYWHIDIVSLARRPMTPAPAEPGMAWRALRFAAGGQILVLHFTDAAGRHGIATCDGPEATPRILLRWPDAVRSICHLLCPCTGEAFTTFGVLPDHQDHLDRSPADRARNWKLDLLTGELQPYLIVPPGFRATHEYFSPAAPLRQYYHVKTVGTWVPAAIESVDVDGCDRQVAYASPDRKLGHSMLSADARWMVSDVQDPHNNELLLIDMTTGASQALCWPNSSAVVNETGHVHPYFSPSGRHVVYTSDHTGKSAVYLVPEAIA